VQLYHHFPLHLHDLVIKHRVSSTDSTEENLNSQILSACPCAYVRVCVSLMNFSKHVRQCPPGHHYGCHQLRDVLRAWWGPVGHTRAKLRRNKYPLSSWFITISTLVSLLRSGSSFIYLLIHSLHYITLHYSPYIPTGSNNDIWLAVHHGITFLLLPTWYTNFLFIHTNYIKLNSSTCFEAIRSSSGGQRRKLYIRSLWYRHSLQVTVLCNR
jgi:hypothetical protein